MLSIKLHKKKKPWLGKGSFLVPISNWISGKVQVRNWISLLNRMNRGRLNDAIRYITLVKIPDEYPVTIYLDWIEKYGGTKKDFLRDALPLKNIPDDIKRKLKECFSEPPFETWEANAIFPELILGEALPSSCVKWTKDIQLLYKKGN